MAAKGKKSTSPATLRKGDGRGAKIGLKGQKSPKRLATIRKKENQVAFLEEFSRHGGICKACAKVGITHGCFAMWRKDEKFEEAFQDANNVVTWRLEEVAAGRALDPIDNHGATLLQFLLRARKPSMYTERREVNTTGVQITKIVEVPEDVD